MNPIETKPIVVWWDVLPAVVGAMLLALAWLVGLSSNLVNVLLMAYLLFALVDHGWAAFRKTLEVGFVRRPFAPEHRWLLVQTIVRWAFLGLWVFVLRATIVPLQLGEDAAVAWVVLFGMVVLAALFQLFPKKRLLGARIALVAAMTLFFGVQLVMLSLPPSEVVTMSMPTRSEMLVIQGGSSPLTNHHYLLRAQRNALDLFVLKNGKYVDGPPNELSSYACFGEPLYAPLCGTVVKVLNDRPDVAIGSADREQIIGNHVVLQIGDERFILFAHLKQGSVNVKEGEEVACGQQLAKCGNTGNTRAPHLHMQVQNRADFWAPDLRTFPIAFRDATVLRGSSFKSGLEVLRRNDRIEPRGVAPGCL